MLRRSALVVILARVLHVLGLDQNLELGVDGWIARAAASRAARHCSACILRLADAPASALLAPYRRLPCSQMLPPRTPCFFAPSRARRCPPLALRTLPCSQMRTPPSPASPPPCSQMLAAPALHARAVSPPPVLADARAPPCTSSAPSVLCRRPHSSLRVPPVPQMRAPPLALASSPCLQMLAPPHSLHLRARRCSSPRTLAGFAPPVPNARPAHSCPAHLSVLADVELPPCRCVAACRARRSPSRALLQSTLPALPVRARRTWGGLRIPRPRSLAKTRGHGAASPRGAL